MEMRKIPWSLEVVEGLSETFFPTADFDAIKYVREGVESGRMECWLVDGHSYAITETTSDGNMLMWCYQGKELVPFVRHFVEVARRNKLHSLKYHTLRKGMQRHLREFSPRSLGNNLFEIEVQNG